MGNGRPFYSEFGWAYDLFVDDPVEPWVEAVEAALGAGASCSSRPASGFLARRRWQPR